MGKRASILMSIVLMFTMNIGTIQAKEQEPKKNTKDDEYQEIQSVLPWKQEVEGSVYGHMLGVIERPDPITPIAPSTPQTVVPNGVDRYSEAYRQQELARVGYYWNDRTDHLTISKNLLSQAKSQRRDIYLYVEGKQSYRIHIAYEDIKAIGKDLLLDLSSCRHLTKYQKIAGKDVLWLLQCEKDAIGMKVHVAIKVPDGWKGKDLYHYTYKDGKLILNKKLLKADEEGYVEIEVIPNADQLISDRMIVQTDFIAWMNGLLGKNDQVDRTMGSIAVGCFVIAVLGLSYLFMMKKKGRTIEAEGGTQ